MIHAIRCDRPTFKSVRFDAGFNVVLATRTQTATDKDSRNGAGKTTLIEIVHFCLGSSADKKNRLMAEHLRGWVFSLDIDLNGRRYTVSRSTADAKRILIEGDCSGWPIKPRRSGGSGTWTLSVPDWTTVLGSLMYGLPPQDEHYRPRSGN